MELTLQLAGVMGVKDSDMVHFRRGALLHDIGKLGVPDNILLKTQELTEDEWKVMHRHPQFAFEMLAPISYLKPALDIPYCHHERWDGNGYPRGLKQEQIPLAARIFTVVDVWDALLYDRPYRKAWPKERVIAYLQEQRGHQFDPLVVDHFMKIIRENRSGIFKS
jgi:HD-GYP domain-containing protein (c-di-GMP phosphodiesterase class II)